MNRLQAITQALPAKGVDGLLISNPVNLHYLTGFTGSSGYLVVCPSEIHFITDFRYKLQAARQTSGIGISIVNDDPSELIINKARSYGIRTLGFESSVSYVFYRRLLRKGVRLKAVNGLVEDLRKIKDREEVRLIRKAVDRAQRAFVMTRPYIRRGITEMQISGILADNLKKAGSRRLPFDIIVASGKNSAMPHARPTGRKLRPGDLVIIDWGGEADGYFSDMTRTLLIKGGDMPRKTGIYSIVLQANIEAISAVSAGVHARNVDKTARDVIKKAGYGDFFGHGTGHGVGLDVHELPRVSRIGRETIRKDMVFTIEPGIYLPGVGGVRIEDMVIAGAGGCSVLTTLEKTLEIIN